MTTQQETIQKRLRTYGEPIATSPQLREALTDEQANELIEWGLGVLQREIEQTAALPDTDIHVQLDLKATAVQLIMTLINQLVDHPGLMPDEDLINSRLQRLGKNLLWLTESTNRRGHSAHFRAFKRIRDDAESETVFRHLMAIVYSYFEEAEEE